MNKVTLYSYFRSSSSWRVRIGLNLKQLPYEYVAVNLLAGAQHADAFKGRSPMGKVPVLEIEPDVVLTESMAILEWLDETVPDPPFLPKDPVGRARARQIAEMINSGIQPFQNVSVQNHVKSLGGDEKAWARKFIGEGLVAVERAVAATAGRFAVGDAPGLADIFIVPQLASARRFGADVANLTNLLKIEASCNALLAFAAAAPERQPDAA